MNMKHYKLVLVSIVFLITTANLKAQFANDLSNGKLVVGIGWSIIEDDGQKFENIFDVKNSWNMLSYPTTLRVEKLFSKSVGFVFNATYNKFKADKLVNGEIQTASSIFYAFDFGVKYNFMGMYNLNEKLFGFKEDVFDIYGDVGLGATHRSTSGASNEANLNLGLGMHIFIFKGFGINLDAISKFAMDDFWNSESNYMQYSFGVIYDFRSNKKYYQNKKKN